MMIFDVLNTKCNTSFISRGRRIFTPVSDLGSRFNSILRLECFLVCVYSVFHSDKLFRLVTPYLRISAISGTRNSAPLGGVPVACLCTKPEQNAKL
jgi:hypothetical protein